MGLGDQLKKDLSKLDGGVFKQHSIWDLGHACFEDNAPPEIARWSIKNAYGQGHYYESDLTSHNIGPNTLVVLKPGMTNEDVIKQGLASLQPAIQKLDVLDGGNEIRWHYSCPGATLNGAVCHGGYAQSQGQAQRRGLTAD